MKQTSTDRRLFVTGAAAALILAPLSACQLGGSGGDARGMSREAQRLVAQMRSANALAGMRPDGGLERAAMLQARYMAETGRMEHDTGWGRDFARRMGKVETNGRAAENLARGRMDVARVVDVWLNSPGHRRNMLDPGFARYGLAYAVDPKDPARRYWAMVMAA